MKQKQDGFVYPSLFYNNTSYLRAQATTPATTVSRTVKAVFIFNVQRYQRPDAH